MKTDEKKPLAVQSIAEFAAQNGIKSIVPKVRMNTSGYPFVTFIDEGNNATNVYFSKAAAQAVVAEMPVTKELLKAHQIGFTTNEAGEERVKLISNSERVDLEELLG